MLLTVKAVSAAASPEKGSAAAAPRIKRTDATRPLDSPLRPVRRMGELLSKSLRLICDSLTETTFFVSWMRFLTGCSLTLQQRFKAFIA
ncbi:hypothetical protein [Caballeronia sp. LZ034LL]|uniref:hypothetical protein n=1 Tax=Caballeronia sp. LZ034LL TaxID=3038567 RepID=UPI0028542F2F|nr:hypothetical protein [Caballeronia sp. LZ034LL]MDR5835082.1 hypothetical protein [Caballeronia sp. LZ034LL]